MMGISSPIGSPPHMRGKASGFSSSKGLKRITPAYAGKSFPFFGIIRLHWDHPRICGEKLLVVIEPIAIQGSPPHMRGKADQRQGREPPGRITPAYAGKSSLALCVHHFHKDHPRICGEKQVSGLARSEPGGSPPHMRGKARPAAAPTSFFGITPAYAGKSRWKNTAALLSRDHPRICGEKIFAALSRMSCLGSPPHMRGKGVLIVGFRRSPGITPAYAGKRLHQTAPYELYQDHPRICGEKKSA